jgi:predicted MFS family arabinose efflux permease
MLVIAGSLYLVSYFHRIAPSVMAADLMAGFAITAASLGTLTAIYPYVFAAMGIPAGTLADTLGPRVTLTLGATTMALGATVFGLAPSFAVAYGGRLLVGLGASVILVSGLRLASAWFSGDEFALASSVILTFGNLGGLAASVPLALSVEAIGWRATFVGIAAATLSLGLLAVVAVRDAPGVAGRARDRRPTLRRTLAGIPAVAGNPRTWPPVIATSGVNAALLTLLGLWGVPYLVDVHGYTRVQASATIAAGTLGFVIGAPVMGRLSDRWLRRRRLPFAVSTALYATGWIALMLVSRASAPGWVLVAVLFALGATSCGAFVLLWSCVREVNDPAQVGLAFGFCNTPIFALFALLQWLTGAVLDLGWAGAMATGRRLYPAAAYQQMFAVCAALAVVAFVSALLVTETRCENVWRPGGLA